MDKEWVSAREEKGEGGGEMDNGDMTVIRDKKACIVFYIYLIRYCILHHFPSFEKRSRNHLTYCVLSSLN